MKASFNSMEFSDSRPDSSDPALVGEPGPGCPVCGSPGRFSYQGRDLLYNKPDTYRYMQCIRCLAVYQDPMPTVDEIAGFYPDDYMAYRETYRLKRGSHAKLAVLRHKYDYANLRVPWVWRLAAPLLSAFICRDAIRFIPNGKALDIGCGNGKFMLNMNLMGWHFEGVEFNREAVEICRKAGLKVFHGDIQSAAFEDNRFDLITARHVIEHVNDPDDFLCEIARILKRGGRLLIQTPNSLALGRRWFGIHWYANDVPRHLVLFCASNLNMLVLRHGLKLIEAKLFTTPKIILNSWDYLTKNCGKPSKNRKICRLLARSYCLLAKMTGRGDEVFAIYEKP